ncbi:hypothetical protein FRC06_006049 [Ceratobasidium sp. 370]|nr:hypothetical protein FRC06_006049 [Ceratobasidium sp. 370]
MSDGHPRRQSVNHPRASDRRRGNSITENISDSDTNPNLPLPTAPAGSHDSRSVQHLVASHQQPSVNPAVPQVQVPFFSAGPHQRSFPMLPPLTPASFARGSVPGNQISRTLDLPPTTASASGRFFGSIPASITAPPAPPHPQPLAPAPARLNTPARTLPAILDRSSARSVAPLGLGRPGDHARTSSIASSYTSAPGPNSHTPRAPTFAPSTGSASAPSTESVHTPNTPNSSPALHWPSTRAVDRSLNSDPGVIDSPKSVPMPPLGHNHRISSYGVPPIPRAASRPPPGDHHVPRPRDEIMVTSSPEPETGAIEMGAGSGHGNDALYDGDGDEDEDENENEDEDEQAEVELTGVEAATGGMPRPGGEPYLPEEEREEKLSKRRMGRYLMYELCLMVHELYHPLSSLQASFNSAMRPGGSREYFEHTSRTLFNGSRSPSSVQGISRRLKAIFNDIKTFSNHYSISDFDFSDTDELLRLLTQRINWLKGLKISIGINAWQLLVFIRHSWYHWMRARLDDHPAMQTTTDLRSGAISPAHSAPPRLPTQPPLGLRTSQSAVPSWERETSVQPPWSSAGSYYPPSSNPGPRDRPLPSSSASVPSRPNQNKKDKVKDKGKGKARASPTPLPPPAQDPRNNLAVDSYLLSAPPSVGASTRGDTASNASAPRNPSTHSLRTPRNPTSVRSSRKALSSIGSGSSRPSRAAPPASRPSTNHGDEGLGIDRQSQGADWLDNNLTDVNAHEMARDQRVYRKRALQLSQQQLEFERRAMEIRLQILVKEQEGIERERRQRMQIAEEERRQRMRIAEEEQQSHQEERQHHMHMAQENTSMNHVTSRVNIIQSSVSRQHEMLLSTTNMLVSTFGPDHPHVQRVANHLVNVSTSSLQVDVPDMMNQERTQLALLPSLARPNNQLLSLSSKPYSDSAEPGPSNHSNRLRESASISDEVGTMRGMGRIEYFEGAGDADAMETDGADGVEEEEEEEEEDDLYAP